LWSAALEPERSFRCPVASWRQRETHIAIRSGHEGLGRWIDEERDLWRDYQNAIGSPPDRIIAVWLSPPVFFSTAKGVASIATSNWPQRLGLDGWYESAMHGSLGEAAKTVNLKSDALLCQLRDDADVRFLIFTRSESTWYAGGASVALSYYGWFVPG
jgi:hypothetical protein